MFPFVVQSSPWLLAHTFQTLTGSCNQALSGFVLPADSSTLWYSRQTCQWPWSPIHETETTSLFHGKWQSQSRDHTCRGCLWCCQRRWTQRAPFVAGRSTGRKVAHFSAHLPSLASGSLLNGAVLGAAGGRAVVLGKQWHHPTQHSLSQLWLCTPPALIVYHLHVFKLTISLPVHVQLIVCERPGLGLQQTNWGHLEAVRKSWHFLFCCSQNFAFMTVQSYACLLG